MIFFITNFYFNIQMLSTLTEFLAASLILGAVELVALALVGMFKPDLEDDHLAFDIRLLIF